MKDTKQTLNKISFLDREDNIITVPTEVVCQLVFKMRHVDSKVNREKYARVDRRAKKLKTEGELVFPEIKI